MHKGGEGGMQALSTLSPHKEPQSLVAFPERGTVSALLCNPNLRLGWPHLWQLICHLVTAPITVLEEQKLVPLLLYGICVWWGDLFITAPSSNPGSVTLRLCEPGQVI